MAKMKSEENNETTWLHPVTGKAIGTGFNDRSDLPQGWQEGVTPSGRTYYVDHLNETTTFYHPLTGKSDMDEEYPDQTDSLDTTSATDSGSQNKASRTPSFVAKKVPKTFTPMAKRNPNSVKVKEGWLQKRDHGAIAVWRKRWCILSEYCLFYYKDPMDTDHVGSILLPSYNICPVGPKDKGTKKFAFKCVHDNMRTYYFAGATQADMESWMSELHNASKMQMQNLPSEKDEQDWGRPLSATMPRSQAPNGVYRPPASPNDTYTSVPSPPLQRRHSLEDRPTARTEYEEVPRRAPPQNAAPYGDNQRGGQQPPRPQSVGPGDPRRGGQPPRPRSVGPGDQRGRQPPRPRSVGPGDQPRRERWEPPPQSQQEQLISRSKSLPRHSAPPPQRLQPHPQHAQNPYATMPRNRDGRPVTGPSPTYVDPREIQFRKRQQRNSQPPPQQNRNSQPSPMQDRRRSEPPRRPPNNSNGYGVDRNGNYAKPPQDRPIQQQRSPMQQSSPSSWQPDRRSMPNHPASYERTPPVDRTSLPSNRSTPIDRQRSIPEERIPVPQVQVGVQMSAPPDLRSSQRSLRSNPQQQPQHSSNSRDGRDSVDTAPTRERLPEGPPVSRNATLREERGGDQLAPLAPVQRNRPQQHQPNRGQMGGGPTDRFKKWQQKTQPYILLSTGIRLRLSIAANDLLGKSHEELVLFLIQLRRDKANMEEWLEMIDSELEVFRNSSGYSNGSHQMLRSRHGDSLRRSNPNLNEDEIYEAELKRERDEVSKELEVGLPLINLLDNLVRKGSLYGGQNELIVHEFYKNQLQGQDVPAVAPKMMVEYSRQQEEEKLMNGIAEDYQRIQTAEDRELDGKLQRLRELDQRIQELSSTVYVLKEDKDKLEQSMERLRQQYDREWENRGAQDKIEEQQIRLDRDLIRVRSHLAQGTKDLEDITVENSKLEHEIALLRLEREKDEPTENGYYPGAKELMEITDEVTNVEDKMTSLDRKRAELLEQMAGFRKDTGEGFRPPEPSSGQRDQQFVFQSTDLDTEESWDTFRDPSRDQLPPDRPLPPGLSRPHDLPVRERHSSQPGQLEESPMVSYAQTQDQYAPPPGHPMPMGPSDSRGPPSQYSTMERSDTRGPPSQYSTMERYDTRGPPSQNSTMERSDIRGPPSGYSTMERSPPRENQHMSPGAPQRTPTDPRRTPQSDQRGIGDHRAPHVDGYGQSPEQYGGPQGHMGRPSDGRPHPHSARQERVVQPHRVQVSFSQPPAGHHESPRGQREPPRDNHQSPGGHQQGALGHGPPPQGSREWYPPAGELRSPPSGRRLSGGPTYKVTDLDTRQTWDISQVDIVRSPVDERPLLSPGEVLPRMDPSLDPSQDTSHHVYQGGPPSFSETPSDSEVAELTRRSEPYPQPSPAHHHQPPPPNRGTDSYKRVKPGSLPIGQSAAGGGPSYAPASSSQPPSHDALWHGTHDPTSAFIPIQMKEEMAAAAANEGSVTSGSSVSRRISPLPAGWRGRHPSHPVTETATNTFVAPASHAPPASLADKGKPPVGSRLSKTSQPQSYEYHYSGFKPRSDLPGSRDSDTESTSSSIRNTAVYGPAPFRRSVDSDVRKGSKEQDRLPRSKQTGQVSSSGGPRNQSHPPPYKPPSGRGHEPAMERDVASDTEVVRLPPTHHDKEGLQGSVNQSVDDIDMAQIERVIRFSEEDPSAPRNDGVVKSSLKNVEVDESTGGGLMRTHSLPLSYLRAKRRLVKFNFFANTVHPYPSSKAKLGVPGKIVIPERYNPAEDVDIEDRSQLTEEEIAARDEKAENIAKMLSVHSMQSWHPSELDTNWLQVERDNPDDIHSRVKEEKLLRQETLAKTRALAEEVKQQSLQRGQQREASSGPSNHLSSEQGNRWSSEVDR